MFTKKQNLVEAQVTDGALVVSFPSAETPRVWRAQMSDMKTAALELKEAPGGFALVVRTGQSEEQVAVMPSKIHAAGAMQAIMSAMTKGKGAYAGENIATKKTAPPVQTVSKPEKTPVTTTVGGKNILKTVLKVFGVIFVLFVLLVIFILVTTARENLLDGVQMGVPVPAEQIFDRHE